MRNHAGRVPASDHDLTPRAATALNRAFAVGRVIVGEFLAFTDISSRDDPDGVADDTGIAVRLAGVIDVARDISAYGSIAPQRGGANRPRERILRYP